MHKVSVSLESRSSTLLAPDLHRYRQHLEEESQHTNGYESIADATCFDPQTYSELCQLAFPDLVTRDGVSAYCM